MLEKLLQHLQNQFCFLEGKKLLLAVSGGVDSMVMLDLFSKTAHKTAVAHCNFRLRETESDGDAAFVSEFCKSRQIECFSTSFDTESFAADFKLSLQMAARELRYNWFSELAENHGFDYVLTAHHADDNLETFLINLSRGTGLSGLMGIPSQNGNIIRPMLVFSREEIMDYAVSSGLQWREDSSNASDKYLRNRIRNSIAPRIKQLNADFLATLSRTQKHLRQSQSMAEDASALVRKEVVIDKENKLIIKIFELKRLLNFRAYLYHWLKDFKFTCWEDIYGLPDAQSGKAVYAPGFRLLKDREILILEAVSADENQVFEISGNGEIDRPVHLKLQSSATLGVNDATSIFADKSLLYFPLTIRKWQNGDVFYPSGMDGKKKLSKYYKDEKFSVSDKECQWLLCSGDDIVWVIGKRPDRRFLAGESTSDILKITLVQ